MWIENRWIGATEYIIIYKNGTHELREREDWEEYGRTIKTGRYEDLREYLNELNTAYLESLF